MRRDPDVLTENVVFWLERLQPTFPVFRCGWNPEWPTRALPWVVLFDHEGREVFAGKPERVEKDIVKALAAAPDHAIGGPYVGQKALAAKIVADRGGLGTHLAALRALEDPDPEIQAMIAAAERWFERQVTRIEEDMPGVVEQAEGWDALAKEFAGDGLGERAAKARDALRSAATFAAEESAEAALRGARAILRRCPPRGSYFPYHFTRMNYTVIDDPAWVAIRVRTLTEFRRELGRIAEAWPDTFAAGEASDLLLLHDAPEITAEAARDRVKRAEAALKATGRPAELHEARLLLIEVRDGYTGDDELSTRAEELLTTLRKDRAKELVAAEAEARSLREEALRLQEEVRLGGSLLSREKADEIVLRMKEIAKRSGTGTVLARGIDAYVAELVKSFSGRPLVGVRFDGQFAGPGARIAQVDEGTGAAMAGLVPGDVVLTVAGTALPSFREFGKAIADKKPGESVKIEVQRASGATETLDLLLGRRPQRRR